MSGGNSHVILNPSSVKSPILSGMSRNRQMENETLLKHIEQARAELLAVQNLTPEDRDLVGRLMSDVITHLTENESATDEGSKHIRIKLADQLKQQVTRLEAEHPKLASLLDRVTNMMSSLGI